MKKIIVKNSMSKLLYIKKSHLPEKKFDAVFEHNGRQKVIPFGASGMSDYTKHHDEERKERYLTRHKKNEHWDNPMTPGALSRYILWNKPTFESSLKDFKHRFNV